jgi:integrase
MTAKQGTRRKRVVANREGRVYQRSSDKRWVGVVWPPGQTGGKPVYVYGTDREDAMDKRDKRIAELAAAVPGKDGKSTRLDEYFRHWTEVRLAQSVKAGNLAESTLDSYGDNARLHILPELGSITLGDLSGPRVRQWQDDLLRKPTQRTRRKPRKDGKKHPPRPPAPPLSQRSVTYCRAILHKALADAIKDKVWGITDNVVDLVDPPQKNRKKRQQISPPTKEEARDLLAAAATDRFWCYWLIVLAFGLRRGEGLGLRWSGRDLERKTLKVEFTIQRLRGEAGPDGRRKGRLVSKDLKTADSEQTLPAPDVVLEALDEWRREQNAMRLAARTWLDADLIFTTSLGTALEPRNVNRAWEALCKRAGVRHIRIHDLRHACGTYLSAAGAGQKEIQGVLRHSRMATTEIYVHLLDEMSRDAADRMNGILIDLDAPLRRRSS